MQLFTSIPTAIKRILPCDPFKWHPSTPMTGLQAFIKDFFNGPQHKYNLLNFDFVLLPSITLGLLPSLTFGIYFTNPETIVCMKVK